MLPRRQPPASRSTRSPHAAPGSAFTARRAIILALSCVFLLGVYINFTFLASTSSSSSGRLPSSTRSGSKTTKNQALSGQLSYETREIKHVAFTSGCSELDLIHSEVLAHSLRKHGYTHNITHCVYGCSVPQYEALQRQKNPSHNVEHIGFPVIHEQSELFGEDHVTTTLQPLALSQWFTQELNRNRLKDDDFVMLVEKDAIFTKKADVWNLFREVDEITDPQWFGQDAAWYWPKRAPLSSEKLAEIVPTDSPALRVNDWREYAATAPYVAEVAVLKQILPSVVSYWSKLSTNKKHLAFPLAAAHHQVPFGISGALNVHHYPSRYENWDFVDDIHYNPCNQTPSQEDIGLLSFPITLRGENFTLPQWIDGRKWSFFHSQIPHEFFHCDAWLLEEPSGKLWELASVTKGYERVPTILRRRHTMSVCMALEAYNEAATSYKKAFCHHGFNTNKKIPMEYLGKTWTSALAYGDGTVTQDVPDGVTQYGDTPMIKEASKTSLSKPGQLESEDVHVVFVTGCSSQDHWQSDLLTQSFANVKHRGRLTRVIAGCTDKELQEVMTRTKKAYPFLLLFATKSYATQGNHKDNTPFGVRDWLRSANPPVMESVVIVVDGDFVFTRPLTFNNGFRITTAQDVDSQEYKTHSEVIEGLRVYKPFFVFEGTQRSVTSVTDSVTSGLAIAQRVPGTALGLQKHIQTLCPECGPLSVDDANEFYAVGFPIALAKSDLSRLMDDFCTFTLETRRLDSTNAASLVGFAAAAVKHNLKFTSFDNLAVKGSGGDSPDSFYWGFLELIKDQNPCDDKSDEPLVVAEGPRVLIAGSYSVNDPKTSWIWKYDPQLVPTNLFACDAWLLATPPKALWTDAKRARDAEAMKQAYGLCTSLKMLNKAVLQQRERVCGGGFNRNKALRLVSPRPPMNMLKVGAVDQQWQDAIPPTTTK